MNFTIATLFEEMFTYLKYSVLNRAKNQNLWSYDILNLRTKSIELNLYSLDDVPYGGGNGMILSPTIFDHLNLNNYTHKYYMSPRGKVWNQSFAKNLASQNNANIFILCGRYEGVDQRILDYYNFEEISIGDYILCGGELPAMIMIESIVRLIPNVIKKMSSENESFNYILLEHDLYTKPAIWNNMQVPMVLTQGNHKLINQWKYHNSIYNTYCKRFDLFMLYMMHVLIMIVFYYKYYH